MASKDIRYLRDDVATKIFTSEKCFNYTASVIASTLKLDFDYVRNNLKLITPKIAGNVENINAEVDAIYDLNDCVTNIEINYAYKEESMIKNELYIAQLLLRQAKPGDPYKKVRKVIQINLNAYDMFGEGDFIYCSHYTNDKSHKIRNKLSEIYDINVDYLHNFEYNDIKGLDEKDLKYLLYIFVCSDEKTRKKLYKENPYMNEVFEKMEELTSDFDGLLYYNRKDFLETVSYNHGKDDGMEAGRAEGRAQGRAQGYIEGAKEKQLEIAKEMLLKGMESSLISDVTKLTLKEIETLQKEITKK